MLVALYLRLLAGACLLLAGVQAGRTMERARLGRRLLGGGR